MAQMTAMTHLTLSAHVLSVHILDMKEALVAASNSSELSVTIHDTSIPTPGPGQVLIKIAVTGTNPKDWKIPKMMRKGQPGMNTGDDMAGYVESVGEGVKGFSKGDRVAAFHQMREAYGSFAEYGIAWDYSTFHIPDSTSFEGECSGDRLIYRGGNYPPRLYDRCYGSISCPETPPSLDTRNEPSTPCYLGRSQRGRSIHDQTRSTFKHPPHHHRRWSEYGVRRDAGG